ncbi:XrtA/PEP-CTERM system TPR-repeat protein PrsT [Glaciecola sp. MF2-115]|uniref:XrtA/PEP-CTERM system TPR-repeat protein PrsT n=1 Tax=Glaciecola sp. MF2-115 TaxID=3384827 RepID=UPI0039A213BD
MNSRMKNTNQNRQQINSTHSTFFSNKTKIKKLSIAALLLSSLIGLSACSQKTSEEHIAAAKEFVVNGDQQAAIVELKNAIQLDPKQAEARFELGNLYLEQKKYQAAEKELNRAMELGYSASKTIPLLARAYQRTGANAALEEIDHDMAELTSVEKAEIGYFKAQSLIQLDKNAEASLLIEELQKLDTNSVYKGLVGVLKTVLAEENEKALTEAIALQNQAPLNKDVLSITARLYLLNQQPSEAADVYAKYVKAAPEDIETRFALANMLVEQGRTEEAEVHVDHLLKINEQNPLLNQLKGVIRAADKDFANAQKYSEISVSNGRADPVVRLVAGYSAFQQGDFAAAVTHLSTIAGSLPDNHPGLRILAASQLQTGMTTEASEVLKRLDSLTAADASLFSSAGYELLQSGEAKKAQAVVERVENISETADDLTRLGVLKLSLNNIDGVLDLENAVAKSPESITAKTTLATAYLATNQLDKALALSEEWKREASNDPQGFLLAGEVALRKNDLAKAEAEFLSASAVAPNNNKVQMALVGLDIRNEDLDSALVKLDRIISSTPDYLSALTAYFAIKQKQGKTDEGLTPVLAALKNAPDNANLAVLTARMHASELNYDKALDLLNKIPADKSAPNAFWPSKGLALLQSGLIKEAEEHYESWINLSPNNIEAALGQLLLLDSQNKYSDGLALTKRFLEARDDIQIQVLQSYFYVMSGDVANAKKVIAGLNDNVQKLPFVRGVMARIKLRERNPAAAVADAEVAFEANQNSKNLQVLVMAYDLSGQNDKSYELLKTYSADNSKDLSALMLLAEKEIGKDRATAITKYQEALSLNKDNFVVLNNLAYLLMEENKLNEAFTFAKRAFDLKPNNAATVDTYAQILIRQNKNKEALDAYNRVMNDEVKNEEIYLNYIETLLLNDSKMIAKRRIESFEFTLPKSTERLAQLKAKYGL